MTDDDLPPGPAGATTTAEFKDRLRELKAWSGLSFRQLERRGRAAGDLLPSSTSSTMLNPHQHALPRPDFVAAFTRACGCRADQVAAWVAASRRIAVADSTATSNGHEPEEEDEGEEGTARSRWRSSVPVVATVLVIALVFLGGIGIGQRFLGGGEDGKGDALLLSDHCPRSLAVGAQGPCVQQLQRQLQQKGVPLPDDAWYGPFTKQRVLVFQAFAGLPTTGVADEHTQRRLLDGPPIVYARWTREQVEQRLRKVFVEAPDQAVKLADCLSYLDPLWVMKERLGVRRWGLFQFSDLQLLELQAKPTDALDAEWSIKTAYTIWRRNKSFGYWTCVRQETGTR